MMKSAYQLLSVLTDKNDRKQQKKLAHLPRFRYHPDPIGTGAFEEGEADKEEDDELFHRTPGYISWQGEHWLSCCGDYCACLGTMGTRELKAMDIAEAVFSEYATREEFENVEEFW